MENEEEIITQENDTEETENDVEQEGVDVSELQKEIATLKAQKDHWRKKASEKKDVVTTSNNDNLSIKDTLALVQAGVADEDIDEIAEYASFKKITIAEALKSDVVKTILSTKNEYRKTAEMANATPARKGVSKVSDTELLNKLSKGEIPETEEERERLFWARRGGKR